MLKGSDRVTAAGRQAYRTSRCGKQMAVTIWSYTGTSGGGQGGLGSGVPPPALVLQWCNTGGENRCKRMNERSCSVLQAEGAEVRPPAHQAQPCGSSLPQNGLSPVRMASMYLQRPWQTDTFQDRFGLLIVFTPMSCGASAAEGICSQH